MDVLNKKERQKAFWKFFGLFIVTVGLASFAGYFNMKVPQKENKVLNDRFKEQDLIAGRQMRFASLLDSINNGLDTLMTSPGNKGLLDQTINNQIIELKRRKPVRQTGVEADMYDNTIELCLDLSQALKQLREITIEEKNSAEYLEELRQKEAEIMQLKNDLKIERRINNIQ